MDSKDMKMSMLHAVFIIKDFICNENNSSYKEEYNYEKYLLELINKSIYFREKSGFEEYTSPQSEDNGECDCISKKYKLDFKLLESSTRFQASKELTDKITVVERNQYVAISPPRKENYSMEVTLLHAAIRNLSCEELNELFLDEREYKHETIKKDIKNYLKMLNTKKNLFLFFPYKFYFEKPYNFRYAIKKVNDALAKDFKESNLFREKYCGEYDTFLAFIYNDNLIISKFEKGEDLKIVDTIYLFKSETYEKLYDFYFH